MSCPLSVAATKLALRQLPFQFSTLDFIEVCPNSGGTRAGTGCVAVRASGKRAVCGKGLAEFASNHPDLSKLPGAGSPALWLRAGDRVVGRAPTVTPPDAESQAGRKPGWVGAQQRRQVAWKEDAYGVAAKGEHEGRPVDFLLPASDWARNLLDEHREEVVAHIQAAGVELHTFAHHVLSSQIFALNLAAPFFARPGLLAQILTETLPDGPSVASVEKVEAEVSDPANRFGEPGRRGANATSADLGIWWTDSEGKRRLLLVEVKYTEAEFGQCSKGRKHGDTCDTGGAELVEGNGALCPLTAPPHSRTYWHWMQQLGVFKRDALANSSACPFRHDGYQLMRNQVLAAMLEREDGIDRADFAVMLHDGNQPVRRLQAPLGGTTDAVDGWRALLREPSRFVEISPRRWLEIASRTPELAAWSAAMRARYFGEPEAPLATGGGALTPGHIRAAEFLGSPEFARTKAAFDEACGRGLIYFRVVDNVLNAIALHPEAPSYVGHRTGHKNYEHILRPDATPPTIDELRERNRAFEAWLPNVRRSSAEERAVISWLRPALNNHLWLPDLGPGWVFLNQEWRFRGDDGRGRKSDLLAVHLPTGTLGIVEAKSRASQRSEAAEQVQDYQRYWLRDQAELAPFFTSVLQAMGRLYDNPDAAVSSVKPAPSVAFFLAPSASGLLAQQL
jgi:hypothetical protein